MIAGIDLIRAIEVAAEEQVRYASAKREKLAEDIALQIAQAHGNSFPEKQMMELIRALRKKNPLSEEVLAAELPWLDPKKVLRFRHEELPELDRLSTDTHQARTQAAYISTMLRPFNPKYAFQWLNGRRDISAPEIEAQIAQLVQAEIFGPEQLLQWGDDVAELFKKLVVIPEDSVHFKTAKPNGTVSSLSSRTYLQSWLAFIRKNSSSLLKRASFEDGVDLNQDSPSQRIIDMGSSHMRAHSARLAYAAPPSSAARESMDLLGFDEGGLGAESRGEFHQEREPKSSEIPEGPLDITPMSIEAVEKRLGLTFEAENASGEQASCHFESLNDATTGTRSWLAALEAIWGVGEELVRFHAKLVTSENQYSFSLPMQPIKIATERLESLIQRIQDLK